MKHGCCCVRPMASHRSGTLFQRLAGCLATVTLILLPKCPACLAAYLAAATGLGLSFAAATHLHRLLFAICGMTILLVTVAALRRKLHGKSQACSRVPLPQTNRSVSG
ncbi:hypothetical protein GC163_01240 [bacterium]|nr:hypothetical protein [bacterium]